VMPWFILSPKSRSSSGNASLARAFVPSVKVSFVASKRSQFWLERRTSRNADPKVRLVPPQGDMMSRLFDHLIGAGTNLEASQPAHGFAGNLQNASLRAAPRAHSGDARVVVDPQRSE
jgi:hypothetical protein